VIVIGASGNYGARITRALMQIVPNYAPMAQVDPAPRRDDRP
jgi:hypothetical protein